MLDQNNKINNFERGNNVNLSSSVGSDSRQLREVPKYIINIFKYLKLLILIEIILVLVFGYFFLIKNKLSSINEKRTAITEREKEVNDLINYKSKSEELAKKYEAIKASKSSDIEKIKAVLPSESDLPGIMAQIEALVKENGMELGSISMSGLETSDNSSKTSSIKGVSKSATSTTSSDISDIKEVNVTMFVFGSNEGYDKIKSFLSALENHIRLIDVTSFTFDEKMSSYSINFKTYYLANEK